MIHHAIQLAIENPAVSTGGANEWEAWLLIAGVLVGALLILVGWFMVVVAGFKEHVLWGLGLLFLGPLELAFVLMHWDRARLGFWAQVVGFLVAVGALAGGYYLEYTGG